MDLTVLGSCLETLSSEAKELYLNHAVPVLDDHPTPLQFYREWISPNKPVVIKGVMKTWSAPNLWTNKYFREKLGHKPVTVAVTPNGYADAIEGKYFMLPEERSMTFTSFLDILEGKVNANGVFYVQKQNSNFTDDFRELMDDATADISWATEAFGKLPDAVNFWIGESRAVTSMHKDHYENIYCVVRGEKTFTLLPPSDQPLIPYEEFESATYKESDDGEFAVIKSENGLKVPWIPVDPLSPDLEKYPDFSKANPLTITVRAGETLYLPSLWYHHVQQSHGCVAVNYWYDMEFDIKYNYHAFVEKLLKLKRDCS